MTSVFCHTGAGGVQVRVGGVRSTLNVKVGEAELKIFPLFVTTVSTMLELSVAAYVITVVPSFVTGMLIDPLAPVTVPDAGLGKLAPVAL
jgi:hypothetical protein